MKKVKIIKGLSLNKETVTRLSDKKMSDIKGGAGPWTNFGCHEPSGINRSECCGNSYLWCNSYGCANI